MGMITNILLGDWYHSAQSIRTSEEYNVEAFVGDDSDDENVLSQSQAGLEEVIEEEQETTKADTQSAVKKLPVHEVATNELYTHEVLALLSCFVFPLLGAYLLHTIRSQLSRPSEGLVSDYNLTIFVLASELRPMAHLVKLIQARTLHLQRLVESKPFERAKRNTPGDVEDLIQRIEELEARTLTEVSGPSDHSMSTKQTSTIIIEVRKNLQPDLDALTRAVRRYEKRAITQAIQTESKLQELEARLNDAISLAAAAANNGLRQRGFTGIIADFTAASVILPLQLFGALTRLPFKILTSTIGFGRNMVTGPQQSTGGRKGSSSRSTSHNRVGDRLQGKIIRR
jgi:hypothetical protein